MNIKARGTTLQGNIEMGHLDEECDAGDPPEVQWSGLRAFTAEARVQPLAEASALLGALCYTQWCLAKHEWACRMEAMWEIFVCLLFL